MAWHKATLIKIRKSTTHIVFPKQSLLLGFSRHCLSSLDLSNFVVRSELRSRAPVPAQARPGPAQAWSGNLEIWEPGSLEIWDPTQSQKGNLSKSKSVWPKMLARSRLVRKKHLGLIWSHFRPIFCGPNKCKSCTNFADFP